MSANATFCATLVDEWVVRGLEHAVIAPGSRSTPLALALRADDRVTCHTVLDERSAAFVALGLAADGGVSLVLCTSGTAAVNLHPAVVEAGLSDLAVLVCTADRPPELRGVGAPQTIDQIDLFGSAVRWSVDAPVPDDSDPAGWRELARLCIHTASGLHGGRPGPVQVNLPFREPLVGPAGPLPVSGPATEGEAPVGRAPDEVPDGLLEGRGLVIVGGRHGCEAADILRCADRLGWPVLADPASGLRGERGVISTADAIVRSAMFTDAHQPDVVIRIGRPHASKVLPAWIAAVGCPVVQVGGPGHIDPDGNVVATTDLGTVERAAGQRSPTAWLDDWQQADREVLDIHDRALAGPDLDEPTVVRVVAGEVGALGARLVVSSSMPVRDLEWFGGPDARAHSNRGANGIDGVVSTALGIALRGAPTVALVGDLAFVHDANALWTVMARGVDLRVVIVDNDGGGIFSFLPQAVEPGGAVFEDLFGTPHGADVLALAAAFGVPGVEVGSVDEFREAIRLPGPRVIRVVSDRSGNVAVHERLHAAAVVAVDALAG